MPRKARVQYPKHETTCTAVEAVLDASLELSARMHGWLDALHSLREDLRQAREDDRAEQRAVKAAGGQACYLTKADQYRYLSELSRLNPIYKAIHSQVLQDVADRIERGTKAWLRGDAGPLRPQPRKKYHSFTFTQYGFAAKIRSGRLYLSKLGDARLIGLRKLPGRVKAVTLTFKQGRWFAQFLCEVQVQHCPRVARNACEAVKQLPDTGLDTGLARVATLADGTVFEPAKPLKKALPRLRREQRAMSRKFEARTASYAKYRKDFLALDLCGPLPQKNPAPLSNRLKCQIRTVAILHTKVECTRRDVLRKTVRKIEQCYRLVAVEEHGVEFMRRNRRTSRTVSDVAPGMFKSLLKLALGEDRYVSVGTSRPGIGGNSQTCLCGESVPKELADRWHSCPACGLEADRDAVSANIAMEIAFGYSNLGAVKPPEPGQGFVRCGEDKRQAGQPVSASRRARTPASTESPVKRQFSSGRRPAWTAGAQATAAVKNIALEQGAGPALERVRRSCGTGKGLKPLANNVGSPRL